MDTRRTPDDDAWTAAALRDWAREQPHFPGRPETLSFGGGTPSRASLGALEAVVRAVDAAGEVSLEANPEDVTPEALRAWRDLGVTRLSLGVQTFDPGIAPRLGRAHSARQARSALEGVAAAGFASFSVDLIFGLPEQGEASLLADIDLATSTGTPHVSLYSLTIEPGTSFAKRGRTPVEEEAWVALHEAAVARLAERGLDRYELSNFARPGHRSVHNEHYWRARRWAGLGPAAHGWRPDGARVANPGDVAGWLAGAPVEVEHPEPEALLYELVWSTLRHVDGVDRELVRRLTGLRPTAPRELVDGALVDQSAESLRLRPAAFAVSDAIVARVVEHTMHAPPSARDRG